MVVIPAGSFMMGSPPDPEQDPFSNAKPVKIGDDREKPQHRVNIQSFAIGKYEVTQEQWYAVMGNNPSSNKGRTLPVENVSWDDAQLFVQKLSQKTGKKYRLPSEAEWEYAARAGSTTTYPWGNSDAELHVYAWFIAIANGTNPVGLKKPNQFGLYDMLGNVWEWTQDCWNPSYSGAPTDGSAWMGGNCSQRVLRGGSWGSNPQGLRTAFRFGFTSAFRDYYDGFRVARTP
jgi:formylglycine-generating enzyme required for sulfatase activity